MKIISIIGKARSGKDTTADYLLEQLNNLGYKTQREAFATPLKDIVASELKVTLEELDRCKNDNIQISGKNVRKTLQDTADKLRKNDVNYFVNIMLDKITVARDNKVDFFIITDMRLMVEQDALSGISKFIKLSRESNIIEESNHPTEMESNNLYYDYKIDNAGTLSALYEKLDSYIATITQ